MANLLSWAGNAIGQAGNAIGTGLDKIIPGNQSFLHPTAPVPTNQQRMAAANIGRGVGLGNSNSTQPYSPPMAAPTPQSFNIQQMVRNSQVKAPQAPQAPAPMLHNPFPQLPNQPLQMRGNVSPLDVAAEAVKGIGGDLLHGVTRIAPTVAASVAQPGSDAINQLLGIPKAPITINTQNLPGGRAIFGNTPISTYQAQAEQGSQFLKNQGVNNTVANAASIPLAGAMAALDLGAPGLAKGAKPAIESGVKAAVDANAKLGEAGFIGGTSDDLAKQGVKPIVNGAGTTPPPKLPPTKSGVPIPPPLAKNRGLIDSAQAAPNISAAAKTDIKGTYVPKPNTKLMGEAQALLNDHATIDFKGVQGVDQKVAATMQHALNLDKAGQHNEVAALFNNLAEHGTELGRGVQAFSMLHQMSPQSIAISVAGRINKYNESAIKKIPQLTGDQQKMISDKIKSMDNMTVGSREHGIASHELNNMVNSFIPSSVADKAITVWKAGLLTSLRTHERNLVGNATMSAAEIAKDPVAALADRVMQLKTGKRTTTPTLAGNGAGLSQDSRQQVKDLLTKGFDPSSPVSKYDVKQVNWGPGKVQQGLKHYTEAVFRTLGAEDRVGYNSAFARSMHDQAGAEAINAGKKGDKAFIDNLVKNPTDEMSQTATKDASYATFHDKTGLSNLASNIKRTAASMPGYKGEIAKTVSEVLMPFTGVPSSIAGKTIAYSPIGLVKGAVNTGRVLAGQVPELQRQAAQEIGRGTVGTGLFGLGAFLMSKGLMTGQPKNAQEAQQWELENKPANSLLVNGKWRSINSIGPQQLVMLAGAKAQEAGKNGSLPQYAAALGKDQLSQTFLAGVQGPLQALNDPVRYGGTYAQNTAAGLIPNFVKDVAKSTDPTAREINSVPDALANGLPGVRNNLLPKRNVLGQPIAQEPTGPAAFYDLFNSKTPVNNPLINELGRLNDAAPLASGSNGAPSKLTKDQTILGNKTKLNPKQLDQLEQLAGAPTTQQSSQLINTPQYKAASDEAKQTALNNIADKARTQARTDLGAGVTAGSPAASADSVGSPKIASAAQLTLAKDAFDKSGKNYQVVGDNVLRRGTDGTISVTPKIKFDYQLGTATLTSQKSAGDVSGWVNTAKGQLASISKQLQDPSIDPLEAATLKNDASSLQTQLDKYSQYGGFTKPKAAKKATAAVSGTSTNTLIKGLKVTAKTPKAATAPKLRIAKIPTLKNTAYTPRTAKIAVKSQKISIPKIPKFKGYV